MMSRFSNNINVILSLITKSISALIPKKKNRWIFGSWFGARMSDNPKGISDYLVKNVEYIEIIWIVNNPNMYRDQDFKVLKRNSLRSLWYILTAQVAFMNQGYADFCTLNLLGGCKTVQLWHGVAWKKIGEDAAGFDRSLLNLKRFVCRYNYFIAPADNYADICKSAFNASETEIIRVGQPRNDDLFKESYRKECKKKILDQLGCDCEKLIVYLPTFRDNTEKSFSFFDEQARLIVDDSRFSRVLIIEKKHYIEISRYNTDSGQFKNVRSGLEFDTQELLGAADVLVTDYSSCFFDYLVTDRPIIHYVYDYDYYAKSDRGLYYDFADVACGDTPRTINELLQSLVRAINDNNYQKEIRDERRKKYITYESCDNRKKIVNQIMTDLYD